MKIRKKMTTIVAVLFFTACGSWAVADEIACSYLAEQPYGGARAIVAEWVPADTPYCKVTATAGEQTDIEVRLPDNWQNRLLHIGGGGFDGYMPNLDGYASQIGDGYVLAASNGGHRGTEYPGAEFGLVPELTQDYAHTAIGTTVRVAKALIASYYGQRPKYSYFYGCSNGGRGAFNAAAQYSDEYDGVVANAPTRNLSGLIAGGWVGNLGADILTDDADAIFQAALDACDAFDGLEDGIISNPDKCDFDPMTMLCPGPDDEFCLTMEEINALSRIYSDTKLDDGTLIFSRFGFGAPVFAGGYGSLGVGHLQWIVYRDEFYDPTDFDLNRDFPTVDEVIEVAYDFSGDTEPLIKYLRSDKKMIVVHGTDDALLSHYDTIRTFNEVVRAAGGKGRKNAQLYIPAGVGHCAGGPGADTYDLISPISEWVEKGKKPRTLLASKFDGSGSLLFTRPLCEYPMYPHYKGHGDPNDAASFYCRPSKPRHGRKDKGN